MRDRVSDLEKFFIDFTYDRQMTGNLEKAYQTLELWLETYPRGGDPKPHDLLSGLSTHGTGRFERVIAAAREAIAADPDLALAYVNLAASYFLTDRFTADPIGALAHVQLGSVFALSGDETKAKAAYQGFLALWKDADADVPILGQAREEYATLR